LVFVWTDVTDPDSVHAVVDAAVDRFGSLEILMHFAVIGLEKSALQTTLDDWNRIITTNLTA
jgi:NAD(P)-dependent dehydrogenase (short-subunit alcohol dehydrogenase family)